MQGLECRLALSEALGDEGMAYCHQTYSKQRVLISALKSALCHTWEAQQSCKEVPSQQLGVWGVE